MSATLSFRTVGISAGEIAQTAAFLRLVWPRTTRITAPHLQWLYAENPEGPVIGVNAWSDATLVGHYVVIPITARHDGHCTRAALSLNTAVHPDFRGKGLFKTLAEQTYALAAERQVDHIVGVANDNSTPGFVRSLGFQLVSPLQARVMLWPPTRAVDWSEPCWQRYWTAESLAWRLRNTATRYSWQPSRAGVEVNGPTRYLGVTSVLTFAPEPTVAATIMSTLPQRRLRRPRLWFGLDPGTRFPPGTSWPVPDRLRTVPLNLIYRSLCSAGAILPADGVAFAGIDFDVT